MNTNGSIDDSHTGLCVNFLRQIESQFPESSKTVSYIRKIVTATRGFDLPEFDEPKTWLRSEPTEDSEKQKREFTVEITADLVVAWVGHMSHSSRLRMELLEQAALRAVSQSEMLAAATLTRSHMEAAAWACYVNEQLTKIADSDSWDKLRILIPKMLYSSAMAKESSISSELLSMPTPEPSNIMNAIDALDRFLATANGQKDKAARVLYAILCDFAHPTMRGVRHLFDPISERDDSWTIRYSRSETINPFDVQLIMGALLQNMRLGHAAALLMRLGVLEETTTSLKYIKPDLKIGSVVWEWIFLGATD